MTIADFLFGSGIPDNAIGKTNQYYLDIISDQLYKKVDNYWIYVDRIMPIDLI